MNKKIILGLSLLLVAIFGVIGGATYAWLTDKGSSDEIHYKVGNVDYTIAVTQPTNNLVVPGDILTPAFEIKNASTVETNLRVRIVVESNPALTVGTQLTVGLNGSWVEIEETKNDVTVVNYYYGGKTGDTSVIAAVAENAEPVTITSPIKELKIDGPTVNNNYSGTTITIQIIFEAKQAGNVTWDEIATFEVKNA